jgi:SulP family sulfate permease
MAIRQFAEPLLVELAQLPGTHDFLDRAMHPETVAVPGTLIMRPEEPLFFANAEQVMRRVSLRAEDSSARVVILSLEASDDLDSTALEVLGEFAVSLRKRGAYFVLARVKDRPREALMRAGLIGNSAESIALFWSVADAAHASGGLVDASRSAVRQ